MIPHLVIVLPSPLGGSKVRGKLNLDDPVSNVVAPSED
jgi:hypothetical protein